MQPPTYTINIFIDPHTLAALEILACFVVTALALPKVLAWRDLKREPDNGDNDDYHTQRQHR